MIVELGESWPRGIQIILVWYSNGPKLSDWDMARIFNVGYHHVFAFQKLYKIVQFFDGLDKMAAILFKIYEKWTGQVLIILISRKFEYVTPNCLDFECFQFSIQIPTGQSQFLILHWIFLTHCHHC